MLQVQTYNPDEVIVIISVRKYLVVMLWNTNPASRHLQCWITLYSNIKTKHEFGNGTSGAGFMLYYYLLLLLLLLLLSILLLLLYKRKINLERIFFFCEMIRPVRVRGNTPKTPQATSKPPLTNLLTIPKHVFVIVSIIEEEILIFTSFLRLNIVVFHHTYNNVLTIFPSW